MANTFQSKVDLSVLPAPHSEQVISFVTTTSTSFVTGVSRSGSGWFQYILSKSSMGLARSKLDIDGISYGASTNMNGDSNTAFVSPLIKYTTSFTISHRTTDAQNSDLLVFDWRS